MKFRDWSFGKKPKFSAQTLSQSSPHLALASPSLALALEPRFLLDAAAVVTVAEAAAHQAAQDAAASAQTETAKDAQTESAKATQTDSSKAVQTDSAKATQTDSSQAAHLQDATPTSAAATTSAANSGGQNVLFVDARVKDSAELLQGVAPDTQVVYLNQQQDGLQQMADYLAQHPGASSVQIVAHGDSGELWLGGTFLSTDTLNSHADALAKIGSEIQSGGDILIYACNTAKGDQGINFVDSLASLTGHDIAASNNRTGAASDWNLEVATGSIEARPLLSAFAESNYQYDLATITVTTSADSGAGSLRDAISSAIAGDTITFNAGMTIQLSTLASGNDLLVINKNLTIDGDLDDNGTPDVTLDGQYNGRVLDITSGTVTLDGLVIQHGVLGGVGGSKGSAGGSSYGAGIANVGTLTLRDSTVIANFATGGGGGPANNAYGGGGGGGGSGAGTKGGAAGGYTKSSGGTYLGYAGSGSTGGNGGSYDGTAMNGRGGTSAGGGAGGNAGAFGYVVGGAGGTATAGGTTIGGGGGGAGWANTGYNGGNAAGAIFNSGTLFVIGTSSITNNAGAGGGGAGGTIGGAGGTAVGGIWNTSSGTVHITAAAYAAMTGNSGGGGTAGDNHGGGSTSPNGSSFGKINTLGTIDTTYTPDTTPPTITGVTSSTANNTYKVGDTISVQVNFDENVIVTGTPQLTLETGTTDRVVNYSSGTGTGTLTFSYTVQAGDTAADLDYLSTSALALNSGTIKDAAGNSATLTLASPGAAGSLGANKNLVIDGVVPTVTSVNSSTADGTYKVGDTVSVLVNFSEAVTVTGTPQLTLETGTTDRVVNYSSGTGTGTLTFTYTVQAGDTSADLDYQSTSALALNGGTIKDAAGNNGTLTLVSPGAANSLGNNKAIVIDGVAPSVSSINRVSGATTNATSVDYTVTFSENVSGVDTSDFSLTAIGAVSGSIASVAGNGSTYTVTVNIISGDGTLRLDLNNSGTGIADTPGNAIGTGYTSGQTYTIDNTAPAAPSTPDLATASDSGSSSSDNITNNTTPTFTGTADSDSSTVTLYEGTTVLGTATVTGGNWSITSSALSAGPHTLTVKATDAAGNVSSASSGLAIVIDTAVPTGLGLDATTIPTPNATSTATIASLSATDTNAITYSLAVGNGTNDADNGSFAISGTSLKVGGSSLTAGTYKIYVAATDAAGNVANQAFTITIVDPPSISSIVRTGGALATVDTSATSTQYTVTFSESVTGVDTSDFTLTATGTAAGNIASVTGSGTTYTVTVNTLSGDGTLRLDLNNSGTGIQNGSNVDIASGYTSGSTYTLDHTAPNAPSAPDLTSGTDSGLSNSDNITNNTTPTFTGTAESGSTVTLYDTDGITVLGTTTATSGNWSITSSTLSSGSHTVTAKATDAAGNVSLVSSNLVATIDTTAPAVASVSVPAASSYRANQTLSFTVNADEVVTVDTNGGTPRLALAVGSSTVYATYASGSGSSALTFTYTVQAGDTDSDGIAVNALQANGGTLKDTAGNAMTLTLNSIGSTTGVLVDTTPPTVSSVSVPSNGTYATGQNLDFTVNVDEAVTVDTSGGTPRIALTLDTGGTVYASYLSGSATSLVFRYTVQNGNLDSNGITVGALSANGGTLRDSAGNDATLTLNSVGSTASVLVDGQAPVVTSVSVPANATYVAGQNLDFTVNLSEATTVDTTGGTPYIAVTLDTGGTVHASYLSGSGSSALTFRYTVTNGDLDTNGIAIASAITANGGTLTDAPGNNATLTLNSVGSTTGVLIDTVAPLAPLVSGLSAGTDTGASSNDGVTSNTTPTVMGTAEANSTVTVYVDGSSVGTTTANGSGDWSYTFGSALSEGSHSVKADATDSAGNTGARSSALAVTIDTTAPLVPTISGLTADTDTGASSSDGVTNNTTPTVTGTAEANSTVTVYVDGTSVATTTANGAGVWTYTPGSPLSEGSHSVKATAIDAAGNTSNQSSALAVTIDTTAPAVASVGVPPDAKYTAGQNLDFTVSFGESVVVDASAGTPRIALTLDTGGTVYADYVSGSGTSALTFRYTVAPGVADANGITVAGVIDNNGGAIKDAAGNSATPALSGIPATTGILVEANVDVPPQLPVVQPVILPPPPIPQAQPDVTPSQPVSTAISGLSHADGGAALISSGNIDVARGDVLSFTPTAGRSEGFGSTRSVPTATDTTPILSFKVPTDIFGTAEGAGKMDWSARQSNGQPLPGWLSFDSARGAFVGIAPRDFTGELKILVIARDRNGREKATTMRVFINKGAVEKQQIDRSNIDNRRSARDSGMPLTLDALLAAFADAPPAQRDSTDNPTVAAGAPSFTAQLAAAGSFQREATDRLASALAALGADR